MRTADERRARLAPPLYLGLLALAELAVAFGPRGLGVACLAALLLALQLHAVFCDDPRFAGLLFTLSLAPLLRLVTLALALPGLPPLVWQAALAACAALLAARGARELKLRPAELGLRPGDLLVQAGIALAGVPLGLVQYAALQPAPLAPGPGPAALLALAVLVGAACGEELLFRGVMLRAAGRSLGRAGVAFAAAVFAVLHLGVSPVAMLLAFGVGLVFGRIVERTGSLLGVIGASSIGRGLALVVLPLAWRPGAELPDLRRVVEVMAELALAALIVLLVAHWVAVLWRARRGAAEDRALRVWAAEVSRLAAGPGDADLERAARAMCARLRSQHVLVVELDAARARTVVRVSLGASGRRLHGPEGLEAPWAAFTRLVDVEALGPQQVSRHPFSLSEGPFLVMPIGTPGRWAVIRPRPGREDETRRRLAVLVQG